jgi:iron complex outermembrane receptor protein
MNKYREFNKREALKFTQFSNKGYALFSCLGKVVLVGVLSVPTLTYAKADGVSTDTDKVDSTTWKTNREVVLDGVEVTGSRAPLTLGQAARMVVVLDRDQIAQAPVQSVNDLLKYAVGVDVRQRAPLGAQTDISIRGGTSEQITILLNGINICDPQTGHNAFDLPIDISDIERIEVLEGPAGRVFGTSSLLGAINVVTKMPKQTSADVHAEGGSFGYLSSGARGNWLYGKWNNQVSGSYARSDGYSRSKDGGLNAGFEGSKLFYQGQYDDYALRVSWHAGVRTKGWGSSTSYATPKWKADDQFEHTDKIFTAIQAETKQGTFHFHPSIYWNQSRDRYEGYHGQPDLMKYNYNRSNVCGVNLNSYFDWVGGRTAFGAEFRNEDLVSGNLGEPLHTPVHIHGTDRDYTLGLNRTNLSFHLEHNILLRQFTLSAGFIAVKNTWNEMPFKVYPGIDMSYRLGNHWKVYASYNSSLRMPSFTELYYSVGGHKADKYLKPEELHAVEGGVKYLSRAVTASASVFHHHSRNMIDWILDTSVADPVWESVNHTKVNTVGVETAFDIHLQELWQTQQFLRSFCMAYTYLNEDKKAGEHIQSQYSLEYLRHKLTASLQLHLISYLDMGINYRFQDRVGSYTNLEGETKSYSPYGITDVRLSWNHPRYTLYVEGNNLFDKTYVDYGLVPQPGRWFTVGLRVVIN